MPVKSTRTNDPNKPTAPQMKLLKAIHKYSQEHAGEWPFPRNLVEDEKTDYTRQSLNNLAVRCRGKGLLEKDSCLILTRRGLSEVLQKLPFNNVATLSLVGQVKAGISSPDDLLDWSYSEITVSFPEVKPNKRVFAMQVHGSSMEREHIKDSDYAIFEAPLTDTKLDEVVFGDLIVAYYLDPEYNNAEKNLLDNAAEDFSNYRGPTIKFYNQDPSDSQMYLLSWGKEKEINPGEIRTRRVIPLAKAIGIFRSIS